MEKWKEIWENRKPVDSGAGQLATLLALDGYDTGAAKSGVEVWAGFIDYLVQLLGIRPEHTLYEVGCGAGATLYPFFERKHAVAGSDYSRSLIEVAKKAMPGGAFEVREAADSGTGEQFDVVLCNGVFHYFKDVDYAEKTLTGMIRKARKAVGVLEIPDRATFEDSDRVRRSHLPPGEYEEKYKGFEHLYYERDWFARIGEKNACRVEIVTQYQKDANSAFRFNAIFRK